jgi:hypothetical protein
MAPAKAPQSPFDRSRTGALLQFTKEEFSNHLITNVLEPHLLQDAVATKVIISKLSYFDLSLSHMVTNEVDELFEPIQVVVNLGPAGPVVNSSSSGSSAPQPAVISSPGIDFLNFGTDIPVPKPDGTSKRTKTSRRQHLGQPVEAVNQLTEELLNALGLPKEVLLHAEASGFDGPAAAFEESLSRAALVELTEITQFLADFDVTDAAGSDASEGDGEGGGSGDDNDDDDDGNAFWMHWYCGKFILYFCFSFCLKFKTSSTAQRWFVQVAADDRVEHFNMSDLGLDDGGAPAAASVSSGLPSSSSSMPSSSSKNNQHIPMPHALPSGVTVSSRAVPITVPGLVTTVSIASADASAQPKRLGVIHCFPGDGISFNATCSCHTPARSCKCWVVSRNAALAQDIFHKLVDWLISGSQCTKPEHLESSAAVRMSCGMRPRGHSSQGQTAPTS